MINWRDCYKRNRFFFILLAVGIPLVFWYLSQATSNVPVMDYWKYLNRFVDKMYTSGLTLADLWESDGIHRGPMSFLYFLINVHFFHYNTQIGVYFGCFARIVLTILLYKIFKNYCLKRKIWTESHFLTSILVIALAFNLNQYEIITLEFSFSFAVRTLVFVLTFKFTEDVLLIGDKRKNVIEISLWYIGVICLFAAGYFPAVVGVIIFCLIFHIMVNFKNERWRYRREYVILFIGLAIGTLLYMIDLGDANLALTQKSFFSSIFSKEIIKGVLIMLGASISKLEDMRALMIVGLVLALIYLFSIVWYLKKKMYRYSYMPMLMIGYMTLSIFIIYWGRSDSFGLESLAASRYTCETVVGLLGLSMILIDGIFFREKSERNEVKVFLSKLIFTGAVIFVLLNVFFSDIQEYRISQYRKEYQDNLISDMMLIDELRDDELGAFQADPSTVRTGVKIMKHYKLGVFYYTDNLDYEYYWKKIN